MSVPDASDKPNPGSGVAELTLHQIGHRLTAWVGSLFAGFSPRSIDARIKTLADGHGPPTWRGDGRLLVCWLLVWLLVLLSAVASPLIVLFQYVFQEGRWRLMLLLLVVVPVVLLVVLCAVLAIGLAGFQFGK